MYGSIHIPQGYSFGSSSAIFVAVPLIFMASKDQSIF